MQKENEEKSFFEIKNPEVVKCPTCKTIICFENESEAFFRNIKAIYINKEKGYKKAKCSKCKSMVDVNM